MRTNLMIESVFILGFVTEIVLSYDFVAIWLNDSITSWYIIQYVPCDVSIAPEYLQLP